MKEEILKVRGAKEHNLKDVSVDIPKNKLVVITGLSGSGKSSLAFDTIYAEGQRRYVESLSAYARQFLGQMEKPDVESIDGLSPAIAIDQKTSSRSPRSTVGTVTEIHDYLRLLWARIGISYCPSCNNKIEKQSVSFIVKQIMNLKEGTSLDILAPVVRSRKGEFETLFKDLQAQGFSRVLVDGEIIRLDEAKRLDRYFNHDISVVIDRIKIKKTPGRRLPQSVETALELTSGLVDISVDGKITTYSQNLGCLKCGTSFDKLEPRDFSFNSPFGACGSCNGLGVSYEIDEALLIKNFELSINENVFPDMSTRKYFRAQIHGVCEHFDIPVDEPYKNLTRKQKDILLHGSKGEKTVIRYVNRFGNSRIWHKPYRGIVPTFKKNYEETSSDAAREYYKQFMRELPCGDCDGERLNIRSRLVQVENLTLGQFNNLSIKEASNVVENFKLKGSDYEIAIPIIREIKERLKFLNEVGLSYLQLSRGAATLSGGEAQRIRLATQIGSGLTGVLYVLDEPSIGLHQADNIKLIDTLLRLRDLGNTVLVVEHDEETMKSSDHVIDIGWGAGEQGGEIVAEGSWEKVSSNIKSVTGQYLSGKQVVPYPSVRRNGKNENIVIRGAKENNLKNLTVNFPLGKFISVTGVSGSGKSTLITDILSKSIQNEFSKNFIMPGLHKSVSGLENIDKLIEIDQSPIGRTPRSNPATYSGVFDQIRNLFSLTEESKIRGYKPGRFSFNVPGGRCEFCKGDGNIKVEMYFLPDIYVVCDECNGTRYNSETLSIRWKGYNIAEILNSTVENALNIFENQPSIYRIIKTLDDVGLSYIKLGQAATTLSGGEAQRVKLAKELSKRSTGKTVYILDEPTTGLHFADVQKLLEVLHMLVDKGNTVIVIEHNLDVIKNSDWIIDLGPEGGENGGTIIGEGTPESISKNKFSLTGKHLKEVLNGKINLNEIPNKSGIYIFKDDYDEPIYVGKAKNLRKRVPSYFNKNTSWKTKRLTSEAKSISFVVSQNEANALLAEYSFIQEFKPKYNIQFKDDKSYPYVTITNEEWPRAFVSRNINHQNVNFGPFPFIGAAKRSLDHLINIFPVRTCTKNTFERHQKLNKPCLLYEIDKCSGPCVDLVSKDEYRNLLSNLREFYKGNSDTYINEKIKEMKTLSKNQEYEEANKVKITLSHLENARVSQTLMTSNDKNVDVIGIDIGRYDVVLSCLLIRNGRIVGEVKNNFEPMDVQDYENYLPKIIINLFEKNIPSNEILVSHEFPLSETILKELEKKWDKKITLSNPKRGWKKDLLNTAIDDAKELRRVADLKRRSDLEFRSLSLEQLQHKLNLKKIPYRIEAYDISNLGDKFRVGSMVVMEDGISKPSMYRKFHIKSFKGQDDFRSMEEVIFRRIKRLNNNEEKDQSFRRYPDLILIDGGKGQLSKAKSVIDHFKLDIDVIGIAKKEEELFSPNKKSSIVLNSNSEALFILQNIRDEAHRFAIQENRRLRLKDLDIESIFEIKGVAKSSIDLLLEKYKTLNKLSSASYKELSTLIDEKQATKVYQYFNK